MKKKNYERAKDFGGVLVIVGFTAFIITLLRGDLGLILGLMLIGGAIHELAERELMRCQNEHD